MNLITTEEASKRLFTTRYTVRKYIRKGLLEAIRVGKQYLIEEEKLTLFLESLRYKAMPGEGK